MGTCNITDLGVVFDPKLSFRNHLEEVILEANKAFEFIVTEFRSVNNINALNVLYYFFVESKFEYAGIVWFPVYRCHIAELKHIQKQFLKYHDFKINLV